MKDKKKDYVWYISGRMAGLPEMNYPAFHGAARKLKGLGHKCLNPAEVDGGDTSKTWEYYINKSLVMMLRCNKVMLLKDWHLSRGACFEVYCAVVMKMPLYNEKMQKVKISKEQLDELHQVIIDTTYYLKRGVEVKCREYDEIE